MRGCLVIPGGKYHAMREHALAAIAFKVRATHLNETYTHGRLNSEWVEIKRSVFPVRLSPISIFARYLLVFLAKLQRSPDVLLVHQVLISADSPLVTHQVFRADHGYALVPGSHVDRAFDSLLKLHTW